MTIVDGRAAGATASHGGPLLLVRHAVLQPRPGEEVAGVLRSRRGVPEGSETLLTLRHMALQALDADVAKAAAAVAVAKARAGTTATRAVQEGVQMHGGMGMTDQFDIGFFMKRARVCEELFGDANYHTEQLARARGY